MVRISKAELRTPSRSEISNGSGMDLALILLRQNPEQFRKMEIPMGLAMVPVMRASARRTEQDTVDLPASNLLSMIRSGAVRIALLLLICGAILFFSPFPARAQEKDTTLEESGIHYPGGFDPNTVGEVQGKSYGYVRPSSGPVRFRLESGKDNYIVLASPKWYWNDLGANLSEGTEVRVRGSKSMGKDGNLYIIAQEIWVRPSGKTLVLRDEDGFPLWKGPKMGIGGSQGGFGSPQKGMGGPGGMGRGRR